MAGFVGVAVVMYAKTIGSTVAGIVLIYSLDFSDIIIWLAYEHAEVHMANIFLCFLMFAVTIVSNEHE